MIDTSPYVLHGRNNPSVSREAVTLREQGHDASKETERTHGGDHWGWRRPSTKIALGFSAKGYPGIRYSPVSHYPVKRNSLNSLKNGKCARC